MLQWLYTYVASFCSLSSIFSRCMLQVCLFGCCICFTHMLQVFYLDVAYVLQWFLSVFRYFCKCFRCLFQVFYMRSDVCCQCCIWMLQKQIGYCISLLTFCCLTLVSPLVIRLALPPLLEACNVRDGVDLVWVRETARETVCIRNQQDITS